MLIISSLFGNIIIHHFFPRFFVNLALKKKRIKKEKRSLISLQISLAKHILSSLENSFVRYNTVLTKITTPVDKVMIDLFSTEFHLLYTPFEHRYEGLRFNGGHIVRWQGRLIDPLGEHRNFRNKNRSYESQPPFIRPSSVLIKTEPNHRPPLFINAAINIGYHVNSKLSCSWLATPNHFP